MNMQLYRYSYISSLDDLINYSREYQEVYEL